MSSRRGFQNKMQDCLLHLCGHLTTYENVYES